MNVKPKQNWVLIAFVIGISVLLGIPLPMKDKLECNLSNGDQYILENKYQYYLIADLFKFILWHAATRQNESGFKVYFKPKGAWFKGESIDTDSSLGAWELDYQDRVKAACARFNLFDSDAIAASQLINKKDYRLTSKLYQDEKSFPMLGDFGWKLTEEEKVEEKSLLSNTEKEQAKRVGFFERIDHQRRKEYGFSDSLELRAGSFISKIGDDLWKEFGFVATNEHCPKDYAYFNCPITAVWQAQSSDKGKTWSKPIITKDAKLFAIGKSILDQPAVAKPGKWSKGPG